MGRTLHQGAAIVAGYPWSIRLRFSETNQDGTPADPVIPAGVPFIADVKYELQDVVPLTTLTTAAGSLVRVNDFALDVFISGPVSNNWKQGRVVLDFARADSQDYLGIMLAVPVRTPVTRRRP